MLHTCCVKFEHVTNVGEPITSPCLETDSPPPTKYLSRLPSDVMPEPTSDLIKTAPNIMPHQPARPWTKDLTLYEEYKIRRNELRRRNLTRRRELEKTLPQPLLADMASPAVGVEILESNIRTLHCILYFIYKEQSVILCISLNKNVTC